MMPISKGLRGDCVTGLRVFHRGVLFAAVKMCDSDGFFSAADIRVVLTGVSKQDVGGALRALRGRGLVEHIDSGGSWRKVKYHGCWQLPQHLLVEYGRIPIKQTYGGVGVGAS